MGAFSNPANAASWLIMMRMAAAFTKPAITGWLSRLAKPPMRPSRNSHSTTPTCKLNTAAISTCRWGYAEACSPIAAATMRAATATGPTTSCRDDPSSA